MIVVTTDQVSGREIETTFGLVRGTTVRARHVFKDIGAVFRILVGGEILPHYLTRLADGLGLQLDAGTREASETGTALRRASG